MSVSHHQFFVIFAECTGGRCRRRSRYFVEIWQERRRRKTCTTSFLNMGLSLRQLWSPARTSDLWLVPRASSFFPSFLLSISSFFSFSGLLFPIHLFLFFSFSFVPIFVIIYCSYFYNVIVLFVFCFLLLLLLFILLLLILVNLKDIEF